MAATLSALILNNCKITRKNHKSYSIIYHRDKTLVYYRTYSGRALAIFTKLNGISLFGTMMMP